MSKFDIKKVTLYLLLIMVVSYIIGFSLLQNKDLIQFGSGYTTKNLHEVNQKKEETELNGITRLNIATDSIDIQILPATEEKILAHLHGNYLSNRKNLPLKFLFKKEGDILNIEIKTKKVTLFDHHLQLDIYLPESYQKNLKLATASGDCNVDTSKTFKEFIFSTSSGDFSGKYISAKSIQLSSASGDLKLDGDCDTISIHTASGRFTTDSLKANTATTETASGWFKINGNFKDFHFTSASGDLSTETFESERARVKTASGNISLKGIPGDIEANSMSGNIFAEYTDFQHNINANSMSGNIKLQIPKQSAFQITVNTASGTVDLSESFPVVIKGGFKIKNRFEGTVRDGQNLISSNTASGNVEIIGE